MESKKSPRLDCVCVYFRRLGRARGRGQLSPELGQDVGLAFGMGFSGLPAPRAGLRRELWGAYAGRFPARPLMWRRFEPSSLSLRISANYTYTEWRLASKNAVYPFFAVEESPEHPKQALKCVLENGFFSVVLS